MLEAVFDMKTLALKEFFQKVSYDWKKDQEDIKTICYYTKTRVNPKIDEMKLMWSAEQTFLIKAIAEWVNAENFFEIGTGRGTACYAVSLIPSIQNIHTVDILNFHQKFATAIGHKPANVSLSDIRELIPFEEKDKITFHIRKEFSALEEHFPKQFDLAFIDGDHDTKSIILEDYDLCKALIKDNGIILWDDYDPDRFAVKGIVEELLEKDPELDAVLIEQRGHLFTDKPEETDKGVVIMKKGKIFG